MTDQELRALVRDTIARHFAARHAERVHTLTVVGTPPPRRKVNPSAGLIEEFEKMGVEHWARRTMAGRLGSRFPPEGAEWWIRFMGRTAVSTQLGFMPTIAYADITDALPRIRCPTLVITTEGSALGSVEEVRAWQRMIPRAELLVLPGDSYHVATSDADACARATLDFIGRHAATA